MNNRETVIVKENQKKIEKIKKKYKNISMSDKTAENIINLEITNNVLKTAATFASVATVINFFIPDPVPLLDEAVMTGVSTLLGIGSNIVENKIDALAKEEDASLKMEEVTRLGTQIKNVVDLVKSSKQNISF